MEPNKPSKRQTLKLIIIIFSAILFYNILQNRGMVSHWLAMIGDLLSPIIIGVLMAFIINIPLDFFENTVFRRVRDKGGKNWQKWHRPLCLLLSVILLLGIFSLVLTLIIPAVRDTAVTMVQTIPSKATSLINSAEEWLTKMHIPFSLKELATGIDWSKLSSELLSGLTNTGGTVISVTTDIVGGIFNFVIGFTLSLYILGSKEKLMEQFCRLMEVVLPRKVSGRVRKVARLAGHTFTNFITGQLTEAVLLGMFCYLGMLIFRMPYAIMISTLLSVTALIPVFGAFVGTAIGGVMILFVSPIKAVIFVVFIIVLQQIDNNVVYPRIVGNSVGLPGIWVLCAVSVGGGIFGPAGMFLSVPLCAVLYCLVREYVVKKESEADNAPAPSGPGDAA